MSKTPGTELVDPRVAREQEWALEGFRARLTFAQLRSRALLPPEEGGLGYAVSVSGIRALVAAARTAEGDIAVTREERRERQGMEIDARARTARYDLERAHRDLLTPRPDRAEFYDSADYRDALAGWAKQIEAAAKIVESADRRLGAVMEREAKLFGLDAATRIEAEVTTHDGALDDLNEALIALGGAPVEVES